MKSSRLFVLGILAALLIVLVAVPASAAYKAPFPVSKPVVINIIDVAGNAQLSQAALDAFKAQHKEIAADITLTRLTAPELAAKIKTQQDAKNMDTTFIFTGFDGLAACVDQGLLEPLTPTYQKEFQSIIDNYLPGALASYEIAGGYGITTVFCPGGPMLTYNPDAVKKPIKTPADLLEWAKENPNKFFYARPANSGPGRGFLMGLPYLLGDKDPKDPDTLDKTWAYLQELDKYIEYYPTGTAVTFKELGDGTRDVIASHLGWDMNQRILGTIPEDYQGSFFEGQTFVNDSQFACIPKGLSDDLKNASLNLIVWLMQPDMQAIAYDDGYFYPGPALKDITIDMAPKASQQRVGAAMRPEYDEAIAKLANTTQLPPAAMVKANEIWDKLVGAKIQK
jgi:putative spermidine/putrescine transport system substrate-binding protein